MARETTIRNQSCETISLIPYSCANGVEPRSVFPVETDLAINIPRGETRRVNCRDYDSSGTDTGSQIYMLFRVGEAPRSVQPLAEERLFLYTGLAEMTEWNLSLSIDGRRQVIGGPGRAADRVALGANAAGPQDARLRELMDEVQRLTQRVEALSKRVADLETALAQR